VVFSVLPDNTTRVLSLQSGDIDIAHYVAPESVATLNTSSNLAVATAPPVALAYMYINHRRGPWQDLRVRQAIAQAVDREALVRAVMQGQAIAATGPFPPSVLDCGSRVKGQPFNPGQARQLLAQAGYQDSSGDGYLDKDGQTLVMTLVTYRQRPELVPIAETIQASLKNICIKVEVRMVENINNALAQSDWDGGMYFNNMATTGDPYWGLSQFFVTGGPANRGGFSSAKVDALAQQVSQTSLRQTRQQLACEASQAVVDEVATVPLLYPNFNYGVSRQVTGFGSPHPFFLYFLDSTLGKR